MFTHICPAMPHLTPLTLGLYPTPLHRLDSLTTALRNKGWDCPELFIKRDDLNGTALGGNKLRKLSYLLADAKHQQADCIVTAGAAQSNHCRQTAAAAAMLGLPCYLLLGGQAPDVMSGNLLLDQLFNANLVWCGEARKGETMDEFCRELSNQGNHPYAVPYGGSNAIGALGFVDAIEEVCKQTGQHYFDDLVFASSSGGTHAGLAVGNTHWPISQHITGVKVDKVEPKGGFKHAVDEIAAALIKARGDYSERNFAERDTGKCPPTIEFDDAPVHLPYGEISASDADAIRLLANAEGILLDPVYAGRAFAILLTRIKRGMYKAEQRVLFWHTGGIPALFASTYADSWR